MFKNPFSKKGPLRGYDRATDAKLSVRIRSSRDDEVFNPDGHIFEAVAMFGGAPVGVTTFSLSDMRVMASQELLKMVVGRLVRTLPQPHASDEGLTRSVGEAFVQLIQNSPFVRGVLRLGHLNMPHLNMPSPLVCKTSTRINDILNFPATGPAPQPFWDELPQDKENEFRHETSKAYRKLLGIKIPGIPDPKEEEPFLM